MFSWSQLPVFGFVVWCCVSARADAIFSNITGNTTFQDPICTAVFNDSSGCPFGEFGGGILAAAVAFTPDADFTITDAQVLVRATDPFGDTYNSFGLSVSPNSNGAPGVPSYPFTIVTSVLTSGEGVAAMGSPPSYQATASMVTVPFSPVTLIAGTEYWLTMQSLGGYVYWDEGGSQDVPGAFINWNGYTGTNANSPQTDHQIAEWFPGTTTLQFEIDGVPIASAVPEPSYFLVLAIILLGGVKYRRKVRMSR